MTMRGGGLWPTRTNLFRYGQCDATTDSIQAGGGAVTITTDATTPAQFSPQSIKVVTNGAAAFQGVSARSATGQAAAAGTNGVGSIYVKGVAGQQYLVRVLWINTDASNALGATTTVVATGAMQLVTPAALAVAVGKTGDQFLIQVLVNGTRAESFWVAHAMLESGQRQVSPYVPTRGGSTASRPGGRRWQLENSRRMMHRYAQVWP